MFELLISILATFGIASLVADYDGPWNIFLILRGKASLMRCCVCLSVWLAIPITIVAGVGVLGYLATIGGVILLERLS